MALGAAGETLSKAENGLGGERELAGKLYVPLSAAVPDLSLQIADEHLYQRVVVAEQEAQALLEQLSSHDIGAYYDTQTQTLHVYGTAEAVQSFINEAYFQMGATGLQHVWFQLHIEPQVQANGFLQLGDVMEQYEQQLQLLNAAEVVLIEQADEAEQAEAEEADQSNAATGQVVSSGSAVIEQPDFYLALSEYEATEYSQATAPWLYDAAGIALADVFDVIEAGVPAGGQGAAGALGAASSGAIDLGGVIVEVAQLGDELRTRSSDVSAPVDGDDGADEPADTVTSGADEPADELDTPSDPSPSPTPAPAPAPAPPAAPVNATAGPFATNEDTALDFVGLSVSEANNDPLISVDLSVGTGVLSFTGAITVAVTAGAAGTSALTIEGSLAAINSALNLLRFTPDADRNGVEILNFVSDDQVDGSDTTNYTINVAAVNDAPVLDNTGSINFTTIVENNFTSAGDTVASLIASSPANGGNAITDVDAGAVEGIAVIGADTTNGTWEFSTNGGGLWTAVGAVAAGNALLLEGTHLLRFVPNAGYSGGGNNITFVAWDTSSGSAGTYVDASVRGGITAFSTDSETATLGVSGINVAPVLAGFGGAALNISEPVAQAGSQLLDGSVSFTDADGLDFDGGQLTVTYNGAANVSDQLGVQNVGSGAGQIGFDGTNVTYGGITVGSVNGMNNGSNGADLILDFNTQATASIVDAIIEHLLYSSTSQVHDSSRTIEVTVSDGDGGSSAVQSVVINVADESEGYVLTAGNDTFLGGTATDTITGDADDLGVSDVISLDTNTNTVSLTGAGSAVLGAGVSDSLILDLADAGAYSIDVTAAASSNLTVDGAALGAANALSVDTSGNNNNISIAGGAGNDTITGDDTSITSNLTITGGAGTDVLQIGGVTNIHNTEVVNISGVERIELISGISSLRLTDAYFAANAVGNQIFLDNGAFGLSNLQTPNLNAIYDLVVTGTGLIVLGSSADSRVSIADGVNGDIFSNSGDDTVTGRSGDDRIRGNNGEDSLTGGSGNDTIDGGGNADTITGGLGADSLTGGTGRDVFAYTDASESTSLSRDVITDFTIESGSRDSIDVTGLGALNYIDDAAFSGATNELRWWIDTGNNRTFVEADINADGVADLQVELTGEFGFNFDHFVGALTDASNPGTFVTTASAVDNIGSDNGTNLFQTTAANFHATDTIAGGFGLDTLQFLDAVTITAADLANKDQIDIFQFDAGSSSIELIDAFVASAFDNEVQINNQTFAVTLNTAALTGGNAALITGTGAVTLVDGVNNENVEIEDGVNGSVIGGTGDDEVIGGTGEDTIAGGDGADFIVSGNGADSIDGGDGNDTINAGSGNNTVFGGLGGDSIIAGNGTDSIEGGDGADTIDGGSGNDTIHGGAGDDYLDGAVNRDSVTGGDGNDTLIGGHLQDTLEGGNDNDLLDGGSSGDLLDGGAGDDTLGGGTSADTLTGGTGNDVFDFDTLSDSPAGTFTDDHITDFTQGDDLLDVSGFLAIGTVGFIGGAAFSGGGGAELRQTTSGADIILEIDTDGDATADFQLELENVAITITIADFV